MRISRKILIIISISAIISGVIVGIFAYKVAKDNVLIAYESKVTGLLEAKRTALNLSLIHI